jgi:hypothetical protein
MDQNQALLKVRQVASVYTGIGLVLALAFFVLILEQESAEALGGIFAGLFFGIASMFGVIYFLAIPFTRLLMKQSAHALWIGLVFTILTLTAACVFGGLAHGLLSSGGYQAEALESMGIAAIAAFIIGGIPALVLAVILSIHLFRSFYETPMPEEILDHGI